MKEDLRERPDSSDIFSLLPSPFGRAFTYLTDQKVRGAHDSIKPGVERSGTPGYGSIKKGEPAGAGESRCDFKTPLPHPLPPAPRASIFFVTWSRGSRPGLYADVRSAHSERSVKYVNTPWERVRVRAYVVHFSLTRNVLRGVVDELNVR